MFGITVEASMVIGALSLLDSQQQAAESDTCTQTFQSHRRQEDAAGRVGRDRGEVRPQPCQGNAVRLVDQPV